MIYDRIEIVGFMHVHFRHFGLSLFLSYALISSFLVYYLHAMSVFD